MLFYSAAFGRKLTYHESLLYDIFFQFMIQVSHIFQDASTGSAVRVVLVKLVVVESDEVCTSYSLWL